MIENEVSYDVRGAAFKVYNSLGPGLLESVYEHALMFELRKMGHSVKNQVGIPFDKRLGLLINFNASSLKDNIKRVIN